MEGILNKKGFTFVEVVFAITISAVIFTAVLPLIFNTTTQNQDTKNRLIAYEAATNQIEQLRETKIATLVAPSSTAFAVPEISGAVGNVSVTKNLTYNGVVDPKIANVRVTVNWTYKSKPNHVELNTYLYGSTQ